MSDEHKGGPRVRQSILAMLMKMENHDPLMYRELLLRGRPGHWRVELLKGDVCVANPMSGTLAEALSAALAEDLKSIAGPGAATEPPQGEKMTLRDRWPGKRVRTFTPASSGGDLFGPLT